MTTTSKIAAERACATDTDIILEAVARDARVSDDKLRAELGCSLSTVKRHVRSLVTLGVISRTHGSQRERILTIPNPVTGTSSEDPVLGSHNNAMGFQATVSEANLVEYMTQVEDHLQFVAEHMVWVNKYPTDCILCDDIILPGHGQSIPVPDRPPKFRAYKHGIPMECT